MRLNQFLNEGKTMTGWYEVMPSLMKVFDEQLYDEAFQVAPTHIYADGDEFSAGGAMFNFYIQLSEKQYDLVMASKRKIAQRVPDYAVDNHMLYKSTMKSLDDIPYYTNGKTIKELYYKPAGIKLSDFIEKANSKLKSNHMNVLDRSVSNLEKIKNDIGKDCYFHSTWTKYDVGDVIKPYFSAKQLASRMPLGSSGYNYLALEADIESGRPSNKPSRENSAFAFIAAKDLMKYSGKTSGGGTRYVYIVKMLGKTHTADMAIVDKLEALNYDMGDALESAYDNGYEFDKNHDPIFVDKDDEKYYYELDNEYKNEIELYWKGKPSKTSNKSPIWEIFSDGGMKVIVALGKM